MKLHKNQSGFGHIEVFLVVIVIALVGAVGWLVYDRQNGSETSSNVATKEITNFDECAAAGNPIMETYPEQCAANGKTFTKPNQKVEAPKDQTTDWITYNDRSGKYSLKHPVNWVIVSNIEYCSDDLLLIGVKIDDTRSSVGKCGSDGAGAFGQIHVSQASTQGDSTCIQYAKYDSQNTITESSTMTVSGVSATRTVIVTKQSDEWTWPIGTKYVKYCLDKSGTTYLVQYTQPKPDGTYPDALSDFDTMVTKTLTIN